MNKRIFTVIASAAVVAAAAQAATTVTYPDAIWDYKFTITANSNDKEPSQLEKDWIMYGKNDALNPSYSSYWTDSFPWSLVSFKTGEDELLAASSSAIADKSKLPISDWLVTKDPIKVNTENAVVMMKAFAGQFNGLTAGTLSFMVKASTIGNSQSDFPTENLGAYNIATSNLRSYTMPLTGVKDKDVYLAFINNSADQGVLGIGNFQIVPYAIEVENVTPEFVMPDSETLVKIKVMIRTAQKCDGFTCVLTDEDGEKYTFEHKDDISEFAGTYDVVFDKKLNIGDAKKRTYTITITPNYEGAPATVVTSEIINSVLYPKKVVVEEGTGTWCQWCPRGTAYLEYNTANFPNQFIGIAVHGSNGASTDPMEISGRAYLNGLSRLGVTGYPSGLFNRQYVTSFAKPTTEVRDALQEQATQRATIERADYDNTTGKVTVYYNARFGYNSTVKVNMAVVLVENGCKGATSNWGQQNAYARMNQTTLETDYGQGMWPYFQRFCEGTSKISASKMVYDHVARGIYPSFSGKFLNDTWDADEPVKGSIEFVMPDNVQNDKETAVVLLMLNAATGEILSASKVEAEQYNVDRPTDVAAIEAADVQVNREGNMLRVDAEAGAQVSVYSVDGTLLATKRMNASTTTIDGSAFSGMIIVKVDNATGKLIW